MEGGQYPMMALLVYLLLANKVGISILEQNGFCGRKRWRYVDLIASSMNPIFTLDFRLALILNMISSMKKFEVAGRAFL